MIITDSTRGLDKTRKFIHIQFDPRNLRSQSNAKTYHADKTTQIPNNETVRDLGVLFCNDLSFTCHVDATCTNAKQMIGWTLRTFKTRDRTTMLTLWKSLILPKIEYCSQLLSSLNMTDLQKLEGLQRSFTSYINGQTNKTLLGINCLIHGILHRKKIREVPYHIHM